MKTLTRKEFLRMLAKGTAGSVVAVAPFLTACDQAASPAEPVLPSPQAKALPLPSDTPVTLPSPTAPLPTATGEMPQPSATEPAVPTPLRQPGERPAVMRFYPDAPSRVVQAHLPGVWQGDELDPGALGRMLDLCITRLTGLNDAAEAWKALFSPDERVAVKLNTIAGSNYHTRPVLVNAVVERLLAAGVKAENVILYDRSSSEIEDAGFQLNPDGAGVRCYGTGRAYRKETAAGIRTALSEILYNVDALINMPILKNHGTTGISFALKNHYGSINNPVAFHGPAATGMPGLNALPVIQGKTRLIVGDALTACLTGWGSAKIGDSILMSFDPVAHDAAGLRHWIKLASEEGNATQWAERTANGWLQGAQKLGIGACDFNQIDYLEETLS